MRARHVQPLEGEVVAPALRRAGPQHAAHFRLQRGRIVQACATVGGRRSRWSGRAPTGRRPGAGRSRSRAASLSPARGWPCWHFAQQEPVLDDRIAVRPLSMPASKSCVGAHSHEGHRASVLSVTGRRKAAAASVRRMLARRAAPRPRSRPAAEDAAAAGVSPSPETLNGPAMVKPGMFGTRSISGSWQKWAAAANPVAARKEALHEGHAHASHPCLHHSRRDTVEAQLHLVGGGERHLSTAFTSARPRG